MICNHCGNNIPENATFCPVCGARAAEPIRPTQDRVLKKVGMSKFQFFGNVVATIIMLYFFLEFLFGYISDKSDLDSSWFTTSSQREALSFIGILTFFLALYAIILALHAVTCYKMFLCVCENTVYGVSGKNSFLTSEPFQFSYDEILNVKKDWQHRLVIETKSKTCKLYVAEQNEILRLIQKRMYSVQQ